ncbi:MAG: NAD(P)H-hydrate dehydratase [Bacteroidales bacterium]|nr:NAD(P)H-hydrate dehydratase [Bacteroidales bacterium]
MTMIVVERPELPDFLCHRDPESHKGTYGHALLVAGGRGKMGAAVLSARACLRSGVGLLTVHVPRCGVEVMQVAVPEAMVSVDEDEGRFAHEFAPEELARYDAVAVGPGIGTESQAALRSLLAAAEGKAVVIDADGLNMLARMEDGMELLRLHSARAATILTPHAREFERLFGTAEDEARRLEVQREQSRATGCVIVRKGHRTQTTGREGEVYVNSTGNAGMATAGSGDVLTGVMLAIMAQNKEGQVDAAMCAALAVWIHGKSGDLATEKQSECSLTAGDIVENLKYATMCDRV